MWGGWGVRTVVFLRVGWAFVRFGRQWDRSYSFSLTWKPPSYMVQGLVSAHLEVTKGVGRHFPQGAVRSGHPIWLWSGRLSLGSGTSPSSWDLVTQSSARFHQTQTLPMSFGASDKHHAYLMSASATGAPSDTSNSNLWHNEVFRVTEPLLNSCLIAPSSFLIVSFYTSKQSAFIKILY